MVRPRSETFQRFFADDHKLVEGLKWLRSPLYFSFLCLHLSILWVRTNTYYKDKDNNVIQSDAPVVVPFTFPINSRIGSLTSVICSVSKGSHPLEFRWTKNGKPIESRNIEVGYLKTSSIINFDPITSEDGGEYKCTVKNSVGNAFHSASLVIEGESIIHFRGLICLI